MYLHTSFLLALVMSLFLPLMGMGQTFPVIHGTVLVHEGKPRPFEGTVYLEIYLDRSRPAAYRPQELMVMALPVLDGKIKIPHSRNLRTILRAFAPGYATTEVHLPISKIPGASLGADLVLEEKRNVRLFRARLVDRQSGRPIRDARFLFDDRDHRTLREQISQRPERRPGVPIRIASGAGEIFLATDRRPFRDSHPINLSIFHSGYATVTMPARRQLRKALRSRVTTPVTIPMERVAVIEGQIGPENALGGAEPPHVRLKSLKGTGRREVRIHLDKGGNFRANVSAGQYSLRLAHDVETFEAQSGKVYRIERD